MLPRIRAFARAHFAFSDALYFSMAFVGVYAILGFVRVAMAAQTGAQAAVVDGGLSPSTWQWMTACAGGLLYISHLLDPANTDTKWNWSVSARVALFTGTGIVVGLLHYVLNHSTESWTESLAAGITTVVLPQVLHFAPAIFQWLTKKGTAGAAVLLLALGFSFSPEPLELAATRVATHEIGGLVACSALFPNLNTTTVITDLNSYELAANTVSSWAADAWALVSANATPAEETAYNDAQASLKASVQLAQDAAAGVEAGTGATPNWAAIFGDVAQAADQLVTLIESFGSKQGAIRIRLSESAFSASLARLHAAQTTLHAYRHP